MSLEVSDEEAVTMAVQLNRSIPTVGPLLFPQIDKLKEAMAHFLENRLRNRQVHNSQFSDYGEPSIKRVRSNEIGIAPASLTSNTGVRNLLMIYSSASIPRLNLTTRKGINIVHCTFGKEYLPPSQYIVGISDSAEGIALIRRSYDASVPFKSIQLGVDRVDSSYHHLRLPLVVLKTKVAPRQLIEWIIDSKMWEMSESTQKADTTEKHKATPTAKKKNITIKKEYPSLNIKTELEDDYDWNRVK